MNALQVPQAPVSLLPNSVVSLFVENFLTRVLRWRRVASGPVRSRFCPRSRTGTTRLKLRQWEHLILTSYLQPTSLLASFGRLRVDSAVGPTNRRVGFSFDPVQMEESPQQGSVHL